MSTLSLEYYSEEEEENKKRGLLFSLLLHLLFFLICYIPFLSYQDPPPRKQGILINFGTVESGGGDVTPAQQKDEEVKVIEEKKSPATKENKEEKKESKPVKEKVVKEDPVAKKVDSKSTQDVNDVIATKKVEKSSEEIAAEQKAAKEAKEAAAAAAKAEEFKQAKSQFGDLFSKGRGPATNNQDKGDPKGKPNQEALEGISTGLGVIGGGLSNRGLAYEPEISEDSQKTGKVVIKVCVDNSGEVVSSRFTQRGSTTTDEDLIAVALGAAKRYKFVVGEIDKQCGTITIDFKLK